MTPVDYAKEARERRRASREKRRRTNALRAAIRAEGYTIKEFARLLNVDRATLYRWIDLGDGRVIDGIARFKRREGGAP